MDEIIDVEMETVGGTKYEMKLQKVDDWEEIPANTNALLVLINGQRMIVNIKKACEFEGVSFKLIGSDERSYHYEPEVIQVIYQQISETDEQ